MIYSPSPKLIPTRAHSDKERATWIGPSGGKAISGMSSSLLTNLAASTGFFLGREAKKDLKASAAEGGGGEEDPRGDPAPPWRSSSNPRRSQMEAREFGG